MDKYHQYSNHHFTYLLAIILAVSLSPPLSATIESSFRLTAANSSPSCSIECNHQVRCSSLSYLIRFLGARCFSFWYNPNYRLRNLNGIHLFCLCPLIHHSFRFVHAGWKMSFSWKATTFSQTFHLQGISTLSSSKYTKASLGISLFLNSSWFKCLRKALSCSFPPFNKTDECKKIMVQ